MLEVQPPTSNLQLPTSNFQPLTSKIEKYESIMQQLKKALNSNGWDGRWYKRAFMDDGNILGSMANDECRIDSIAQSWSTISNAGDNDKKYISMESLENHLIDRENGIIKPASAQQLKTDRSEKAGGQRFLKASGSAPSAFDLFHCNLHNRSCRHISPDHTRRM